MVYTVTNVLEMNNRAHDPIFATVVAHEILRNNEYHPSFAAVTFSNQTRRAL